MSSHKMFVTKRNGHRESRSPKMSVNGPVHPLRQSSDNHKSMDVSEWISISIVIVFVLFFLIIGAFYIYGRVSSSMAYKFRSFLWRTGKYTSIVLTIISLVFSIIKYISHRKKIQNEDQAAIQNLVGKSIQILRSPDEPRSMPIVHVRDTLLTQQQRKDSRWKRIWSKVVEFIENNDYHINSAIEEIDGEEFKTWKWCGTSTTKDSLNGFRMDATTMRTGTIEWQGSAFDSTSDTPGVNTLTQSSNGSINSVPKALTEFLKLRNIPNKNGSSSWKTQLRNAIIEKCTAYSPSKYHGILHIDFGSADKEELFIYLKCDSIESATNNFAALHGWWCERHLVSVKFLKADRYYEKFPQAVSASTPLKILNTNDSLNGFQMDATTMGTGTKGQIQPRAY